MARPKQLPPVPQTFMDPDRASAIFYGQLKKKLQRQFGGMFAEARDEVRRELGLSEAEAKDAVLYIIAMSRLAMAELFDEYEERMKK